MLPTVFRRQSISRAGLLAWRASRSIGGSRLRPTTLSKDYGWYRGDCLFIPGGLVFDGVPEMLPHPDVLSRYVLGCDEDEVLWEVLTMVVFR